MCGLAGPSDVDPGSSITIRLQNLLPVAPASIDLASNLVQTGGHERERLGRSEGAHLQQARAGKAPPLLQPLLPSSPQGLGEEDLEGLSAEDLEAVIAREEEALKAAAAVAGVPLAPPGGACRFGWVQLPCASCLTAPGL